jgi:hypothetical protein
MRQPTVYHYSDDHDETQHDRLVERTSVDIRERSDPAPENITWGILLSVILMSIGVTVLYVFDIYFSFIVDTMILSMWLAVNGIAGTYLMVNTFTHWVANLSPDYCKSYIFCARIIHIVGSFFMAIWTVLGWIYFLQYLQYPTHANMPFSFNTFMWFHLIFQVMLVLFYLLVSYVFCKHFIIENSNS